MINNYSNYCPAGKSFHSVQEVVTGDKPRFSISGWYHRATAQQGSEHASLNQLQMKAGEDQIQQHSEFIGELADDTHKLLLSLCYLLLFIFFSQLSVLVLQH